jgi:hypothetical protein
MIVLVYLGSQCTKFHADGWTCWFLRPFIWSCVSVLMRYRDGSDKGTASNFVQVSEKVRRRPWEWLDKRLGKTVWDVYRCLNGMLGLGQTEKGEAGEGQSQEHAHYFLWHPKNLACQDQFFENNSLDVKEHDEHSLNFAYHLSPFLVLVSLDFSIRRIVALSQGHNRKSSSHHQW